MARQCTVFAFVCFSATLLMSASLHAAVLHQYDFEPASSPVTQSGWTHMDSTIAATPTTAGFVLADTMFYYTTIDRGSSTQSPVDVTRDLLIFRNGGITTNSAMRFQDIVPAFASSVTITLYRSDSADTFAPHFSATGSLNGGSQISFGSAATGGPNYYSVLTGTLSITPSGSVGTLDLRLFDADNDSSNTRVNGIQFEYTIQEAPEPSSALLAIMGAAIFFGHRRRFAA